MTLSRFTRTGLLLLFLLVVATGLYLYRNLDAILRHQVKQNLVEFGVEHYDLRKPGLGADSFSAAGLSLSGRFKGIHYAIELDNLVIQYDWRILLTRQARSVSVSGIEIRTSGAVMSPTAEDKSGPTTLDSSSLMPLELLAQLPSRAVDVDKLRFEHAGQGTPAIVVTGHLHWGDGLDVGILAQLADIEVAAGAAAEARESPLLFSLTLTEESAAVAALNGTLTTVGRSDREWRIHGEWQHGPLLSWLNRLAVLGKRNATGLIVEGNGSLNAKIRHPGVLQYGPGFRWEYLAPIEIEADLGGDIKQLHVPEILKAELQGLALQLSLNGGELQVEFAPIQLSGEIESHLLPIHEDARQWLRWGDHVPTRWQSTGPLQLGFDGRSGKLETHGATLQLGTDQSRLSLQQVELAAAVTTGDTTTVDTRLNTRIVTRARRQELPPLDFALQLRGPVEQSEVELELEATDGQLAAALAGTLHLLQGAGEIDVSVQSGNLGELPDTLLPAMQKLGALDFELLLEAGSLELETQLRSAQAKWTQTSRIALASVAGQFDEYRFHSLNFDTAVTGLDTLKTVEPMRLSLQQFDVGFPVTDITARASIPRPTPIDRPALSIEEFSADLFGGQVFLPEPGTWDFGAGKNSLVLSARQWQLAQIVALQQSEDIQAQGILEGKLPVTLADGRLTIDKGYLRALPPGGTIRYLANDASRALGKNSKELAMALALLSDFRYEVLSSDVELDSGGNLLLGLSLAGYNPGQYEGQAVNFNINLEQNLDPLLQSLRLSGKLTEEIENRVQ